MQVACVNGSLCYVRGFIVRWYPCQKEGVVHGILYPVTGVLAMTIQSTLCPNVGKGTLMQSPGALGFLTVPVHM